MRKLHDWWDYCRDFVRFSALAEAAKREPPRWKERFPCFGDKTTSAGFDRHYVYHTAWAARILAHTRPELHVDISSSLYFVGLVSAFVPMQHYDYRPADLHLENLTSSFADLLRLPFENNSIRSLSCMHVVEHVGLGRYGDPLDAEGDVKAMAELKRVIAPGGQLLFVVPVGRPRVCFNAHRIYSYGEVCDAFAGLNVQQFRLVPDDPNEGALIEAAPDKVLEQDYACGCFWLRKPM
jgi:SAM-dependent methyltransferase